MKSRGQIRLRCLQAGIVLITTTLLTGCIMDGRENCVRETSLYISVHTGVEGGVSSPADGATVYLFDKNERYLRQVRVSKEQLDNHTPVIVPVDAGDRPWAVVWANLGSREDVTSPEPGMPMESAVVKLRKDAEEYAMSPGDLYFGIKQLSGADVEEIIISPKTARISLTARGLPANGNADYYYFTVDTYYDGYNFPGEPQAGSVTMKFGGVFDALHDFTTPLAYNMVHYPKIAARNGATQEYAVVNLWQKDGGADKLLASANKDTNGRPVAPQAGKTTNVLIDFGGQEDLEVTIVITDWNEIHQWNEW